MAEDVRAGGGMGQHGPAGMMERPGLGLLQVRKAVWEVWECSGTRRGSRATSDDDGTDG